MYDKINLTKRRELSLVVIKGEDYGKRNMSRL